LRSSNRLVADGWVWSGVVRLVLTSGQWRLRLPLLRQSTIEAYRRCCSD